MHPVPGFQFRTHHTQQVVAVQLAVRSVDDERREIAGLYLGQRLGMRQRLLTVAAPPDLPVVAQLSVALIDFGEHGAVDGLQGHVLRSPLLSFQSVNSRTQRVGSHLSLKPGMQQRRLQQLTIGQLLRSLGLYLLQQGQCRCRQILVLSLLHLFPQRLIGL